MANTFCVDQTAVGIRTVIKKKAKVLLNKDPYFKIEIAVWDAFLKEETGPKLQEAVLLRCSTNIGGKPTLEEVHGNLLKLRNQKFSRVVITGINNLLVESIEVAASVCKDCVPQYTRLGTGSSATRVKEAFVSLMQYMS